MRYAIQEVITSQEYRHAQRAGYLDDMLRHHKRKLLQSLAERFFEECGTKELKIDKFTGDFAFVFDMDIFEAGEIDRIQRNAEAWGRKWGAEDVKRSLPYGMSPDEQIEN